MDAQEGLRVPVITIIGAGNIGGRHLQALASMPEPARVELYDPSPASRAQAVDRWREVAGAGQPMPAVLADAKRLSTHIDVAIIATPAAYRLDALAGILAMSTVRHIVLEKVLFQRASDYDKARAMVEAAGAQAWVNTPRRMWPSYRRLAHEIGHEPQVSCRVAAPRSLGLATNAIHFLDLLAFLSGSPATDLRADRLRLVADASRHRDAVEFEGTLYGFAPAGGAFEFAHLADAAAPVVVDISTPRRRILIDESRQLAHAAAAVDGWTWRQEPFGVLLQSELTHLVAADLIARDRCGLPSLAESCEVHLPYLEVLLDAYVRDTGSWTDTCPIT